MYEECRFQVNNNRDPCSGQTHRCEGRTEVVQKACVMSAMTMSLYSYDLEPTLVMCVADSFTN